MVCVCYEQFAVCCFMVAVASNEIVMSLDWMKVGRLISVNRDIIAWRLKLLHSSEPTERFSSGSGIGHNMGDVDALQGRDLLVSATTCNDRSQSAKGPLRTWALDVHFFFQTARRAV